MRAVDKFIDLNRVRRWTHGLHPGDELRMLGYLTGQDPAYRGPPPRADAAAVRNIDEMRARLPKSPPGRRAG